MHEMRECEVTEVKVLTAEEWTTIVRLVLIKAKIALEFLPEERKSADAAPLPERLYRLGLCDGMEQGIEQILTPLFEAMGTQEAPSRRLTPVCMIHDCGCSGEAHA